MCFSTASMEDLLGISIQKPRNHWTCCLGMSKQNRGHPCCCDQKGIATKGQHVRTRFTAGHEAHVEDLFWKRQMSFFPHLRFTNKEVPIKDQTPLPMRASSLISDICIGRRKFSRSQKKQKTKKPCLILLQRWHRQCLSSGVKAVTVNKWLS